MRSIKNNEEEKVNTQVTANNESTALPEEDIKDDSVESENNDISEDTSAPLTDEEIASIIYNTPFDSLIDFASLNIDSSEGFKSFSIETDDPIYNRIYGKSYQDNPNIGIGDLRYLRIPHYDYSHQVRLGEMIVNSDIAQDVLAIFETLFNNEYEIESMILIDEFWTGDGMSSDDASIAANNTSAFCYRVIYGGTGLSNHAYGRAIDVNPKQNPYYSVDSNGNMYDLFDWDWDYIDRDNGNAHMILSGDICQATFANYGFTWGGYWTNPVDYQHFEK